MHTKIIILTWLPLTLKKIVQIDHFRSTFSPPRFYFFFLNFLLFFCGIYIDGWIDRQILFDMNSPMSPRMVRKRSLSRKYYCVESSIVQKVLQPLVHTGESRKPSAGSQLPSYTADFISLLVTSKKLLLQLISIFPTEAKYAKCRESRKASSETV